MAVHRPITGNSRVIVWPVSITTLVFSDLILVIDVTLVWKMYSAVPETIALPLKKKKKYNIKFHTVWQWHELEKNILFILGLSIHPERENQLVDTDNHI